MKRKQPPPQTRASRKRREALLKAGIWVFLAVFIFSVVGVAIVFTNVK